MVTSCVLGLLLCNFHFWISNVAQHSLLHFFWQQKKHFFKVQLYLAKTTNFSQFDQIQCLKPPPNLFLLLSVSRRPLTSIVTIKDTMQGLAHSAVVAVLLSQNELRARTHKCFIYQNKKDFFLFFWSITYSFLLLVSNRWCSIFFFLKAKLKKWDIVCEWVHACVREWVSSQAVSDFACYFYPFVNYDHVRPHKLVFKTLQEHSLGLQIEKICQWQEIWKLAFWRYYSSTYRLKVSLAISQHRIQRSQQSSGCAVMGIFVPPLHLTWASGLFLWTASWGKIVRINGAFTQCRGKADPAFKGPASVTCVCSEVLSAAAFPTSHEAALCARRNTGFYHRRVYALAHCSVVRVNQINNLSECRHRCCFAFSAIARQMKYGAFCRCHFIRFRLLLITQNGGKENGEHLHVNQTYACRCVESILFSIAFIDFSWVVFSFNAVHFV